MGAPMHRGTPGMRQLHTAARPCILETEKLRRMTVLQRIDTDYLFAFWPCSSVRIRVPYFVSAAPGARGRWRTRRTWRWERSSCCCFDGWNVGTLGRANVRTCQRANVLTRKRHPGLIMRKTSAITVKNLTRGAVVVSAGRVADRFWARLIGLMLARPLPAGAGLVIVPCSSIHTQFMRFPIDVLYVNKQDEIVGIDRDLRPWRIGRFYKKVHYVVELPAGGADVCQVGDRIAIA